MFHRLHHSVLVSCTLSLGVSSALLDHLSHLMAELVHRVQVLWALVDLQHLLCVGLLQVLYYLLDSLVSGRIALQKI